MDVPRGPHRAGRIEDALPLAELVNIAGEGLPLYLWTRMAAPGESPWHVGQERARREVGAFSYRNAIVREEDGQVASCLIGYGLHDRPEPANYDEMPAMFVPLQQLEDLVPGTWYVNVLATYPNYRAKGYGRDLLQVAEDLARASGRPAMSIIVSDANAGALRLYERTGYSVEARRPMVKEQWENPGVDWLLLVKPL